MQRMAGRPAKLKNEHLSVLLEGYRVENNLSYTEFAKKLGVHCATLTRSVSTDLYSRDLELRAGNILGGPASSSEALLLLRKFEEMLPQLSTALRTVLDKESVGE